MQRIEITYKSTNIKPTVAIILFFRLIGIYVSEKFFDYGVNEELLLVNKFPEISIDLNKENHKFDLGAHDKQFYVIEGKRDFREFVKTLTRYKIDLGKCVFIDVSGNFELGEQLKHINGTVYIEYRNIKQLLYHMISVMPLDMEEQGLLNEVADEYCRQELWKISLKGKYFCPADTKEYYVNIMSAYSTMISALERKFEKYEIEFGSEKSRYIQYAISNMMYEADLYCIKNERLERYQPGDIVRSLVSLIRMQDSYNGFDENIQLLLAQVYEDLLKEPNIAYKIYLSLCQKSYSSYVFLKMADYWRFFGKKMNKAIKYYTMSTACFLEYYQAWFHLGCCYVQAGDYRKALDAFWNVKYILRRRRRSKVLRPMEMIYLYKSHCCSGYIQYNYFRELDRAMMEDLTAECIWDEIEQSKFYRIMGEDEDYMKETIKKQFHVGSLYRVIYKLANQLGDSYLAEEYQKKISEVSHRKMSKGIEAHMRYKDER